MLQKVVAPEVGLFVASVLVLCNKRRAFDTDQSESLAFLFKFWVTFFERCCDRDYFKICG